jgi:4-amino-4-deoxy-L-arabinose transferase-like glycosyltransferase
MICQALRGHGSNEETTMRSEGFSLTSATARRLVAAVTVLAAVLYSWGLAGDPTHPYYTAAVRSMSLNWHNFFYGAFDPNGFITTDKLPGSFWIQALFVRALGFHPWVVLLPQVLAATACVPLLYTTVRRWAGAWAALCAIGVFTLTPITVALAHTNIPDALMVFFLVLAAHAFWRGFVEGRPWWLAASALWLAVAFQVKMGQALLVVPVFAGVLLLASRGSLRTRLLRATGFGALTAVLCVSWMALVSLVPAAHRPYVDGSMHDSLWEMVFQYNGIGRMGGQGAGANPLAGGAVLLDADGPPGLGRLFGAQTAGQISWLIPVAVLALGLGLWRCGRAPLTDPGRAGWLFWGGWFAVYSVAFCLASGIHPYYTTSLAPAIAALAGTGLYRAARTWVHRERGALLLPVMVLATGLWAFAASHETPHFDAWLRWSVLDAAALTAGLLAWSTLRGSGSGSERARQRVRLLKLIAVPTAFALLGAPAAWAASVLVQHHTNGGGASAAAGPVQAFGGFGRSGASFGTGHSAGAFGSGSAQGSGGLTAAALRSGGPGDCALNASSKTPGENEKGAAAGPAAACAAQHGGLNQQLLTFLTAHRGQDKFVVAMTSSMSAAPYISAGLSVLPIGGFTGDVPVPTAGQLATLVSRGELRYVQLGGMRFGGGPASDPRTDWVSEHCAARTDAA